MFEGLDTSLVDDDLGGLRRDPLRFGEFRILEKLAGGGMAEIYKVCRADRPDERLALKLIRADRSDDNEFRQMLIDEAKIASRLTHPNIARVIELHESKGELGLLLEYVAGIDLIRAQRVLRDHTAELPIDAAVYMLLEVLAGLGFAHNVRDEHGDRLHVVHRDVSPGNIMIDVDGHVRIVDWGIARAKHRMAQTDAGHVKGKFRYMAPEQITGQAATPQADIYSAAVTFWEVVANQRIYDDVDLPELMMKVAKGDAPSLDKARSGVPRGLSAVFKRATARDPKKRYRSARKFAEALQGLDLIPDLEKARVRLQRLVTTARLTDGRRGYERAVAQVKHASGAGELEGALLRALEAPDRVERVPVEEDSLLHADQLAANTATLSAEEISIRPAT